MDHGLFTHYLLKDILVAFKFWTFKNKTAINICVQIVVWTLVLKALESNS